MNLKSKIENLEENVLLANYTTFRIGGAVRYFVVVKNQEEFIAVIRAAKEAGVPFHILGGGSNTLAADEGFDGLAIKMQNVKFEVQPFDSSHGVGLAQGVSAGCKITCEAGVSLAKIIMDTVKGGYSGAEWGFGIPGTIGGAIFGNAGRLGQDISQVVRRVKILDDNLDQKTLEFEECGFSYRDSRFKKRGEMILGAELEFQKKDKNLIVETFDKAKEVVLHSPKFPSAGCVFKNYQVAGEDDMLLACHPELKSRARGNKIGTGYLINQCGLLGRQIGGAKIWENHGNYIINVGGAKAEDVLALIKFCKAAVKDKYGIELEQEIRYLA